MKLNQQETVSEVFARVLEDLSFLFAEDITVDELPKQEGENVLAEISFSGDAIGSVQLAVPKQMCETFAENVMGLDPDDEIVHAQALDALGEVLNVVCGQLLTAAAGEVPVFDLTVPSVQVIDQNGWQEIAAHSNTHIFMVDDECPVLLNFVINT